MILARLITDCLEQSLEELRVRFFTKIRKRIIDLRSFVSRCIKGTDESTLGKDSSVPLMLYL